MPLPLAVLAVAVAGKTAMTTWAVARWRARPLARIRRAVGALTPVNVTLLRPWPEQGMLRVSISGRTGFAADDLTFGIQTAPGYQGRVALSVIWVDEGRQRSVSLPSGINPALEAAIAFAFLGSDIRDDLKNDFLQVAKNKIPS